MAIFSNSKSTEESTSRLLEEKLYEQVAVEVSQGKIRNGLWAKALANSDGVEKKAKSLYINYRVQSIIDKAYLLEEAHRSKEEELKKETLNASRDEMKEKIAIITVIVLVVILAMLFS